ncbi:phage virion morphogenesis protein [Kamptonema sp. UHCC 0994]|uniref:phage virion morphogenesis protein n=1 Tax=Kamptonema sp. UHCC 0994 TaxID=3031329 RepID=UPI0023B9DE69|nr:phage virion morphogenesis protein [Kamptonema sp. UHCC 0994]MDF0554906.1 phage virion morphogenesis protein [Kamptonema sp. UHCC 0994]
MQIIAKFFDWESYQEIIKKLENPEPSLRKVGRKIVSDLKNSFSAERDPNTGRAWYPLGIQARQVVGRQGILHVKGSIANGYGWNAVGRNLTIYNTSPVGSFHQEGTRYIRDRKFMPDAVTNEIVAAIEEEFS